MSIRMYTNISNMYVDTVALRPARKSKFENKNIGVASLLHFSIGSAHKEKLGITRQQALGRSALLFDSGGESP